MNEVWLVSGECGEYSDYSTWPVRVFANEEDARDFAKQLNDWCDNVGLGSKSHSSYYFKYDPEELKESKLPLRMREDDPYEFYCPLDPYFYSNYTGTAYSICKVPYDFPDTFKCEDI